MLQSRWEIDILSPRTVIPLACSSMCIVLIVMTDARVCTFCTSSLVRPEIHSELRRVLIQSNPATSQPQFDLADPVVLTRNPDTSVLAQSLRRLTQPQVVRTSSWVLIRFESSVQLGTSLRVGRSNKVLLKGVPACNTRAVTFCTFCALFAFTPFDVLGRFALWAVVCAHRMQNFEASLFSSFGGPCGKC